VQLDIGRGPEQSRCRSCKGWGKMMSIRLFQSKPLGSSFSMSYNTLSGLRTTPSKRSGA
jgi:hypothetical protein